MGGGGGECELYNRPTPAGYVYASVYARLRESFAGGLNETGCQLVKLKSSFLQVFSSSILCPVTFLSELRYIGLCICIFLSFPCRL